MYNNVMVILWNYFIKLLDYINIYECIKGIQGLSCEVVLEQIRIDELYILSSRNMYLIYYSFLQEYIDLSIFNNIKEELVGLKYYDSFNNHDREIQLINNNFNVPKINYIIFNIMDGSLKEGLGKELILDCYSCFILTSLVDLLLIKDYEYNDNKKKVESINNQCMLRAGLAMLSEDNYDDLLSEIMDKLIKYDNLDNCVSFQIVNSIINGRIKDKERVRMLSFRGIKD